MKPITRVMAMIHEGSLGKKNIIRLENTIKSTYLAHFGEDRKLVFVWMTIPQGQAYLAGKPSTASTLQIPVADGLPDEKRHPFMHEICMKWMQITGCDKNEIILNSPDISEAQRQFKSFSNKFKDSKRTRTQATMAMSLLYGRIKNGYFSSTINN